MKLIKLILDTLALILQKIIEFFMPGTAKASKTGKAGEDKIAQLLSTIPNSKVYRNLYIIRSSGRSTEIDLVFLTSHRIYVIESKNYNGMIFGNTGETNWTVRYRNGKTFSFYSPEVQNNGHIKALKDALGISDSLICSLIVFGEGSDITNVKGVQNCVLVSNLLQFIYNYENSCYGEIPIQYRMGIQQTLSSLTNASFKTKSNHIKQVKKYNHNRRF